MANDPGLPSPILVTGVGLLALASAMGIGRFAFTPMLPLMQHHLGLTLAQGSWLASSNYAGYLVGALALVVVNPAPWLAARTGLVGVAVFTLAMGATGDFAAWLALRFSAGVASACVLIGISAWALPLLAAQGRPSWSGAVFAGVGAGIVIAGGIGLASGVMHTTPAIAWTMLGACAALAAAFVWSTLRAPATQPAVVTTGAPMAPREGWRPVLCYGAFGFGYIIPATFLPALARDAIADPAVFGWAWPLFGVAAAGSTLFAARRCNGIAPAKLWAAGQLAMAAGVIAPAIFVGLWSILASALLVGGTFMVVTMAGMQHAREVAGGRASRLIAAMTAAFAVGQLAGPLTLGANASASDAILWPSAIAAAALCASPMVLSRKRPARPSRTSTHLERS